MGGTEEGRSLAERACQKFKVFYSLAGRTTSPILPENVHVRSGGFGGAKALSHWLSKKNISAVVDATHPFSKQIKENVDRACHQQQIHRLTLTRPKWEQLPDDQWHNVFDIQMAATTIKSHGKRAFISVGRQELQQFSQLNGIELVIRSIEPPTEKSFLSGQTYITGRGPFTVKEEIELLRAHAIDVIVTKNSGGKATYAKIAAARQLCLPVIIIERPLIPIGETVETATAAFNWLIRNLG